MVCLIRKENGDKLTDKKKLWYSALMPTSNCSSITSPMQ